MWDLAEKFARENLSLESTVNDKPNKRISLRIGYNSLTKGFLNVCSNGYIRLF